jgi:hypothetical protein
MFAVFMGWVVFPMSEVRLPLLATIKAMTCIEIKMISQGFMSISIQVMASIVASSGKLT